MALTRRAFCAGTISAAALVSGASLPAARAGISGNAVRIPPLLEANEVAGGRVFALTASAGISEFKLGVFTPTIGLNGPYLGPTIRCRAGERLTVRVKNGLDEPTSIHWHGLQIPAREDGGPHQVIAPGGFWAPTFVIRQPASLCWYHSHLMGRTGEQVLRGLAGLLMIDDDESRALGLPSEYGVDDIPLIIQDRRFGRDGAFSYISAMPDVMMGYRGNIILVNGMVDAHVVLRRQWTRLRILNASNSRIYTLGRDDARDLVVIGGDGSLLERPVRQRRVRVGVGERIELLVEAEPDQTIRLMNYADLLAGRGMMMGGTGGNADTFSIVELRAAKLEYDGRTLPERLIRVRGWTEQQAIRTRRFSLDMPMMGMGMMGRGMTGMMGINGQSMDMNRIDVRIPLGSVEIWEIVNTTPLAHPFHIHGIHFRVLDRDGEPAMPHERGLKDTVLVDPGSAVRVITEFAHFADPKHPYMYHCHNLEHEDAGMMGQFVVV